MTDLKDNFVEAYFNWGIALNVLGKYKDATKKIEKVIKLNPDHVHANALLLIFKKLETI